ncbi:MAG: rRNA maturation RNase YbeY [Patescibacteria group bacterium]
MLAVRNLTRRQTPRRLFHQLTEKILGSEYELSLVLVGRRRSRNLNRRYRGRDKATNVLSFRLEKNSGEMFVDLGQVAREAAREGQTFLNRLRLIFIHGLLHLKGLDHGSKMESLESQYEKNDRHRTRRWQRHHARGRLRTR